jgi:pimeloyl-ACP methyl ester carboxylesterase
MVNLLERRTVLEAFALTAAASAFFGSRRAMADAAPSPTTLSVPNEGKTMPSELTHRTVTLNGLRFHIAEQGQGPLVLLCHGWPESWYSWRHQLPAVADAGFHAVALDMRGFGQTDAPEDMSAYTVVHYVGDLVQLVSALGEKQAIIIGHDWGATVAWTAALLRPDLFRAVVALSVPYRPRGPVAPLKALRDAGTTTFYWQYFQTPGEAEAELERDVDRTIRTLLYGQGLSLMLKPGKGFLGETSVPEQMPAWLTEADIAYGVETYKRTGFRGGLNWYRNIDRNWELSASWDGLKIQQPALFIGGEDDGVIKAATSAKALEELSANVPGLKRKYLIPATGHWVQQQRPTEVSAAVLEFLRGI